MITAEKHNQCPNVINCYRKILGKNNNSIYKTYSNFKFIKVFSRYAV